MDILTHLLECLQQSNEVGIADLGSFYKKKYPGSYDKEKKSFFPPKYTLHFTTDVKDAQVFETFISTKAAISNDSAQHHIMQFVANVKQKLALGHEVELENIGRLFYAEEGDLNFEASEKFNYGSEFYGLPPIADAKNLTEEVQLQSSKEDDKKIADDGADAASITNQPEKTENFSNVFPIVENIELDEVKTDLANTLAHLDTDKINSDTEEPAKHLEEQQTENFTEAATKTEPIDFEEKQIEATNEHHVTPIVEPQLTEEETETILGDQIAEVENKDLTPPTVLSALESSLKKERTDDQVTDAPEFIKEQHEEYPERFGADPMEHPTEKSIWPKVLVTFIILLLIGALMYFFKSNLFSRSADPIVKVIASSDSTKVKVTAIETAQGKQDSIKKADSVLKANMIQSPAKGSVTGQNIVNNEPIFTFDVIVASYKTEKSALAYIGIMKRNGYDAKIANMTGTRKKISIASFPSEQEAKKQLIILQKKLKGKGFYVQKIKTP